MTEKSLEAYKMGVRLAEQVFSKKSKKNLKEVLLEKGISIEICSIEKSLLTKTEGQKIYINKEHVKRIELMHQFDHLVFFAKTHAIGHAVLHYEYGKIFVDKTVDINVSDPVEEEANYFALGLGLYTLFTDNANLAIFIRKSPNIANLVRASISMENSNKIAELSKIVNIPQAVLRTKIELLKK